VPVPKTPHRFAADPTQWQSARLKPALFLLGLLLCTAAAAVRLMRGTAPDALWLDDQWVAALVRHASLFDLLHLLPPAPLGFIALLKVTALLGAGEPGDAAWSLQVLPLTAALVQIPLIGWIAWRLTGSYVLGVLAAALLCESRMFLVQAVRIKQYTLEGVVALLLIGAAVHYVTRPSRERFLAVPILAAACLPFSFTAMPVGVVAVLCVMAHALRIAPRATADMQGVAARRLILLSGAAYGVCMLLWTAAVQLRQPNKSMGAFWSDRYLPLDDLTASATFFKTNVMTMLGGAMPPGFAFLAAAVPLAILALLFRRELRLAGAAALLFFGGMLFASALQLYPIGGGRTDVFSYPITILTLVGGLAALSRPGTQACVITALASASNDARQRTAMVLSAVRQTCMRSPGRIAGGGLLTILVLRALLLFPGAIITYPSVSGRGAVDAALAEHDATGILLISPDSTWAFALYTDVPVTLRRAPESSNGYIALPEASDIVQLRRRPEETMHEQIAAIIDAAPPRIIMLITFSIHSDEFITRTALSQAGYRETMIYTDDGLVLEFTRAQPEG